MAINKVEFGGQTLMDLTNDTVNSENLLLGATAHGANGELVIGTYVGGPKVIKNQSLTFTNLVATVSDSDITANSDYLVYYHDVSAAESAGITVTVSSGVMTFTATTAPQSSIVVDIVLLDVGDVNASGGHIFAPVIYSDNERRIGVWRDNKPLYQRTYAVTYGTSDSKIQLDFSPEVLMFVPGGTYNKQASSGNMVSYGFYVASGDKLQIYYEAQTNSLFIQRVDQGINGTGYVTICYTKTTDVPGSGNWVTDGVPAIHYSTDEKVIGTFNNKPLYEISIDLSNIGSIASSTEKTITNIANISMKSVNGTCYENGIEYALPDPALRVLYDTSTGNIKFRAFSSWNITDGSLIIQYTKTTD